MCALIRNHATYRTGSLLDNWLVHNTINGHFGAPLTLPGVCGKDHKIAVVAYYYSNGDIKQRTDRPSNTVAKEMEDDDWKEFEKEACTKVEKTLLEAKAAQTAGEIEMTGKETIRTIHTALQELAESILGAKITKETFSTRNLCV